LKGFFQHGHFYKACDSALKAISFLSQNLYFQQTRLMLKIYSPTFTRHHGNYMNYISFLWPPVEAVQAMQAVDVIISWKTILIPRIQLCPSDHTISFQLCRR